MSGNYNVHAIRDNTLGERVHELEEVVENLSDRLEDLEAEVAELRAIVEAGTE
jgi:hypothetical protein